MSPREMHPSSGVGKPIVVALVVLLVVVASASWVFFAFRSTAPSCNAQLSSEVGDAQQHLCLHPLIISILSTNASEFSVPVLVLSPGDSGTVQILYHISASQVNHQGNKANLTQFDSPGVLSISTASVNRSDISFSNGSLIFQNADWVLFKYTLNTSSQSEGYYAILPPFYYGIYPPLVITSEPSKLNNTALSMFGFSGLIQSGEFIIPSTIVGVSGLRILNYSVPAISYCPNAACILITRSLV